MIKYIKYTKFDAIFFLFIFFSFFYFVISMNHRREYIPECLNRQSKNVISCRGKNAVFKVNPREKQTRYFFDLIASRVQVDP